MMDRLFRGDARMERVHSERRDASNPRVRLVFQPFQKPISGPGHPLHPRLIGSGAVLLIAAFGTDLIYARTLLFQWANFSIWLLTGGLILAALAGVMLVLDVISRRIERIDWVKFTGFTVAALLSLLNAFVHSRDAYTAVVPQGLVLSGAVAAILAVIGWRDWSVDARTLFR
jgi:uncharacterized membrane protein